MPEESISFSAAYSEPVQRTLNEAASSFRQGQYVHARALYEAALDEADPDRPHEGLALQLGIANCHGMLNRDAAALAIYSTVLDAAAKYRHPRLSILASVNRASVYRRAGDPQGAAEALRESLPLILQSREPLALAQAASLMRDADISGSLRLYGKALDILSESGDDLTEAAVWNQLGIAHIGRGTLQEAEDAFTHAYRLKYNAGQSQLQSTLFYLGLVKRRQGNFHLALRLLQRAAALSGGTIPALHVYWELGRVYQALGQSSRAFSAFGQAVQLARELRLAVVPAEDFRVSSEKGLQDLYAEYVAAGMEQARQRPRRSLSAQMFAAAQESRWLLHVAGADRRTDLPEHYTEKLMRHRQLVASAIFKPRDQNLQNEVAASRIRLTELEAALGVFDLNPSQYLAEKHSAPDSLSDVRRRLKPRDVLLTFSTATAGSWLWVVTARGSASYRLPPRSILQEQILRFREALQNGGDWRGTGKTLSATLLGQVPLRDLMRRNWILSLDASLYSVPFSALPDPVSGYRTVVASAHAVRLVPSALVASRPGRAGESSVFRAFADPVYNAADSRSGTASSTEVQLPRLPGSGIESRRCARAWSDAADARLTAGPDVTGNAVRAVAESETAVLHLAAHVVAHPRWPDQALIALGYGRSSVPSYLSPAEISSWKARTRLVTLSGCASGTGAAYPGLGLFGLTRAWLSNGSSAVIATIWPVPDDQGELLVRMYAQLARSGPDFQPEDVAAALQSAQIQMQQEGGWRAHPSYWSGYFVTANQ